MKTLPALATIVAVFFLTVGISSCNAIIRGYSTFLLLLVLPALCYQIYEMTPAYKRKHIKANEDKENVDEN